MKRFVVMVAVAVALLGDTTTPVGASSSLLRVAPRQINFGTRTVGTENLEGVTVTNRGKSTVLVHASAGLPDDFGFGLLPGSTCPALDPAPLAPGQSCDAVVRFTPTEFFAGQVQHGELIITVADPATGTALETVVVPIKAKGAL